MNRKSLLNLLTTSMMLTLMGAPLTAAESYYKINPQFHSYPDPDASHYAIKRLGPVGIGLDLRRPNFIMHITGVEKGSPAEACGKLKKGQIIESINGVTLKDMDPRVILGNLITDAEAKDGIIKMMVKDDPKAAAQEAIVKIPALGAYSKTWPVNCKKSDQIVRNYADILAEKKESVGVGLDGSLLFMLSTGEEKDLEVARKWVKKIVEQYKDIDEVKTYPWMAGYSGPGLCEYYLRTGDKSVLPVIKKFADYLTRTLYNGSWMGRGGASYSYMGGGHMNAAGVHCVVFLQLAKECGVDVDEHTLQSTLYHFFRFSGRGNVAYGDGEPEGGMTDNGRTTGLALAMAAAANLHPEGEKSVYAKARDISATKGFYSTSWLFHGHTGGGIGELWRGQSMGLIKDKRPAEYQSFMDGRRWMYELARTHDGVFGWVSGWNVNYEDTVLEGRGWGGFIPFVYTIPRKQLRIHGAPPTQYSKPYKIDRPWGNEADDVFYSLTPGEYKPGKRQDISKERLITDASMPIFNRINDPKVSDDTLLMYAHHIDQGIRNAASGSINKQGRYHLIMPLLKSKDPRGRYAGVLCVSGMGKSLPADQVPDEMFKLVAGMINDPQESWWVAHAAMNALARAKAEQVAPNVDRLIHWLKHKDWWLANAAMKALTPVVDDKRFYKKILPEIGKVIVADKRGKTLSPLAGIANKLAAADPEIQKFAVQVFAEAYENYPMRLVEPGGQDLTPNIYAMLETIATAMSQIPGGFDELYRIAKTRFPELPLPHQQLFMSSDVSKFGPVVKKVFNDIVMNQLIPEYKQAQGKNLAAEVGASKEGRALQGLVKLYQKAGIADYDWRTFGADLTEIKWDYHSFDPPEEKYWEVGARYREVTYPTGMENWFALDFDAAKAGWKSGFAPFGQENGKLRTNPKPWIDQAIKKSIESRHLFKCKSSFCRCCDPMKTLWEKEVILLRTKLPIPKMKKGHLYRFVLGGQGCMNNGDGFKVYANGKVLFEKKQGWGKRQGGPMCFYINDEWWPEFERGEISIAVTSFLRIHKRSNVKGNILSAFVQEMKLPPVPKPAKPAEPKK